MTNHVNMSALSEALSSAGSWQDLIVWDEDIYDPLFHGDTSFTGTSAECNDGSTLAYQAPESVTSEPQYVPSAPGSILDGHSSFEYDAVSGPPSVVDGQSSLGHAFSWLSTSTSATSPVLSRDMGGPNSSFRACEETYPHRESPILDTRQDRIPQYIESYGREHPGVFNPYLASSPYAFNNLDVNASHAFSNLGTWADQPQIVEPISESEYTEVGASPIPIPMANYGSSLGSALRSEEQTDHLSRARALDIPQPSRRPDNMHASHPPPRWTQQVPPVLTGSPVARRRQRSVALSRSNSRNESRRKQTTPSPTSSFGWVSYQPNVQQGRLVPSGGEGSQGRRQRGRTKGLTLEQRRNAALMRVVGACSNCKRRKEKCDPGIPCKSCLDHFKGDLVNHPCRDRLLSDLSKAFLNDRFSWHPTTRSSESFTPNGFDIGTGITYTIPLNFGFGPALHIPVHAIRIEESSKYHEHVIYSWPPSSSTGDLHTHAVLPAVLSKDAESNLLSTLDMHLSLLVTQHFRSFPLYCSPLRMLREIYVYYRSLPTNSSHSRTLHQALKLLVLVHIGGDITLPPPETDPVLAQLVRTTLTISDDITPTPCFIRSQFGSVMPELAMSLMKDVLSSLEQLFLNRECHEWPIALAVLTTVLMTVESIHYHAAKLPYHHIHDGHRHNTHAEDFKLDDDDAVKALLAFYSACFSGCHIRLRPEWEGETIPEWNERVDAPSMSAEDRFIESVRDAIKRASPGGYLAHKATDERQGDDMGFFFDRLAARLLLLKT